MDSTVSRRGDGAEISRLNNESEIEDIFGFWPPGENPMNLNVKANIFHPDDFYQKLISMQKDLSDDDVQRANAKLILLLANHIGDMDVLSEAMRIAAQKSA